MSIERIFLFVVLAILFCTAAYSFPTPPVPVASEYPTLSHAQLVWKYALEWCESNGNPKAKNPRDKDGTPSLGPWQFKPGTLISYAEKYGIEISDDVFDYDSQSKVVDQMILHKSDIDWANEFPGCTKKLGSPPS